MAGKSRIAPLMFSKSEGKGSPTTMSKVGHQLNSKRLSDWAHCLLRFRRPSLRHPTRAFDSRKIPRHKFHRPKVLRSSPKHKTQDAARTIPRERTSEAGTTQSRPGLKFQRPQIFLLRTSFHQHFLGEGHLNPTYTPCPSTFPRRRSPSSRDGGRLRLSRDRSDQQCLNVETSFATNFDLLHRSSCLKVAPDIPFTMVRRSRLAFLTMDICWPRPSRISFRATGP